MNIKNIGGVHDNGSPRLQIGMGKNNGFIIEYNTDLKMITITDSTSGAVLPILAPTASPYTFRGQYASYTALTNAVTSGAITPAAGDVGTGVPPRFAPILNVPIEGAGAGATAGLGTAP